MSRVTVNTGLSATWWLPENASGRVMVTVWFLSSLVIASVYRGNITAMLTLPKIAVPIDSVTDLTNQNRLPWKLEHGGLKDILRVSVFPKLFLLMHID